VAGFILEWNRPEAHLAADNGVKFTQVKILTTATSYREVLSLNHELKTSYLE
jgi:hypothetical protein